MMMGFFYQTCITDITDNNLSPIINYRDRVRKHLCKLKSHIQYHLIIYLCIFAIDLLYLKFALTNGK